MKPLTVQEEFLVGEPQLDNLARNESFCRGCGKVKEIGVVVCWTCYKHRRSCLKYSGLGFESWLLKIGGIINL